MRGAGALVGLGIDKPTLQLAVQIGATSSRTLAGRKISHPFRPARRAVGSSHPTEKALQTPLPGYVWLDIKSRRLSVWADHLEFRDEQP